MKLKLVIASVSAALVFPFAFAESHPHWSYGGKTGASHWADVDEGFKTCKLGKIQSPINIETKKVETAALKPIVFSYTPGPAEVTNTGHTIQVNLPSGGAATMDGTEYKLLQFHFHTPSEEKVDGKAYPLVAHAVHKNADGKLSVVGVLFKLGRENQTLKPVFSNLPSKEGNKKTLDSDLNVADLLPKDKGYYAFMGSLTTPPCSEEVRWQVLKAPVEISPSQLAAFKKLYKMNARPVQPLNGRTVQASQ